MEKNILDFINGTTKAVKAEFVFTREDTDKGMQHITVKVGETELYDFWVNPKKPRGERPPPKHTGGKKPYIMLMVEEIKKLKEQRIDNIGDIVGCFVLLADNIEWGTGRLIHKRNKKSLKYKDLLENLPYGNNKLSKIISKLKEHDLLSNNSEGYFISTKLFKKGKSIKEANRNGR